MEETTKGAVPVATVEVSCPETLRLVPVAAPIAGVTRVGEVANTTDPEPVVEAAEMAVPLPLRTPVIVVVKVREGVVVPEELPAKPLAVATDTVVTAVEATEARFVVSLKLISLMTYVL